MSAYGMTGKLSTKPEDRDKLIKILTQAADLMRDVDDCHMYIVCEDADDEGAVAVIELWDSKEAHDQSLTMPAVRELIGKAMPLLTGQPEGMSLIPVAGKGL